MSEFTCARCGGTFERGRSEEEARAESDALWSKSEMEIAGESEICEDCFREFMQWIDQHPEVRMH